MTRCLHIRNWDELYEVGANGGRWRKGDDFRVSDLEYIRHRASGMQLSESYLDLADYAGPEATVIALGVFLKLTEIAGKGVGGRRGYLLNRHGEPLTAERIATGCRLAPYMVENAIGVLTHDHVKWLEWVDSPAIPGDSVNKSAAHHDSVALQERKRKEDQDQARSKQPDPRKIPIPEKKENPEPSGIGSNLSTDLNQSVEGMKGLDQAFRAKAKELTTRVLYFETPASRNKNRESWGRRVLAAGISGGFNALEDQLVSLERWRNTSIRHPPGEKPPANPIRTIHEYVPNTEKANEIIGASA